MSYTRYYLNNPRKEQYAYIGLRVKLSAGRYYKKNIPNERVNPKYWDRKLQRCSRKHPNHASINRYLDQLAFKINSHIRRLIEEKNVSYLTVEEKIIEMFGYQKKDFWSIWDLIIKEKKNQQGGKHRDRLSEKYTNIKNKMKQFNPDTTFSDITVDYLYKFTDYLYQEHKLSTNTAQRYIKFLNTFMNQAEARGYHNNRAHKNYKIATKPTSFPYLDNIELERLSNHVGSTYDLEMARINLLKGCYSGQRISDWSNVTKERITTINAKDYIDLIQTKTGRRVLIPLHPKLREILSIPHELISSVKFNKDVKKLCMEAGINSVFMKPDHTANNTTYKTYKKWQLVSSHIGRRSFVCNSIRAGIPAALIKEVGGWSTDASFHKYIQLSSTDGMEQFDMVF